MLKCPRLAALVTLAGLALAGCTQPARPAGPSLSDLDSRIGCTDPRPDNDSTPPIAAALGGTSRDSWPRGRFRGNGARVAIDWLIGGERDAEG
jgi:hypothetical protein